MSRPNPYFMHDQVRHRVALIMRSHDQATTLASPVWPLIVVVSALTFINILSAMPPL